MVSCCGEKVMQIKLSQPEIIQLFDISSASGIEYYNGNYYVVGDDNPWLFTLNENFKIIDKTQISSIDAIISGRTPKHIKADFESIGIDSGKDPAIVIISSGSMVGSRDTAHVVSLGDLNNISSKNIRPLFEKIKSDLEMPAENEINIEGLVFHEDYAYLFHRGNVTENFLIRINKKELINYIVGNANLPEVDIYPFNLPDYKNVPSGFSGACLDPSGNGIIFTASMEDTNNEIDDGAVLGSYIGFIPFNGLRKGEYTLSLLNKDSKPLAKKLESICVKTDTNKVIDKQLLNIVTVCDNDDGTSDIITFNMKIN